MFLILSPTQTFIEVRVFLRKILLGDEICRVFFFLYWGWCRDSLSHILNHIFFHGLEFIRKNSENDLMEFQGFNLTLINLCEILRSSFKRVITVDNVMKLRDKKIKNYAVNFSPFRWISITGRNNFQLVEHSDGDLEFLFLNTHLSQTCHPITALK